MPPSWSVLEMARKMSGFVNVLMPLKKTAPKPWTLSRLTAGCHPCIQLASDYQNSPRRNQHQEGTLGLKLVPLLFFFFWARVSLCSSCYSWDYRHLQPHPAWEWTFELGASWNLSSWMSPFTHWTTLKMLKLGIKLRDLRSQACQVILSSA